MCGTMAVNGEAIKDQLEADPDEQRVQALHQAF
jgi:hypothetical protein